LAIVISLVLVFYCGDRWGKTNMLVYISVCSLIGSLSVVFTQGIGGAIVYSVAVENQFTNWFVYLVLIITLVTLAIEIIYLNKALNLFNTAVVTPTYYVIFTTLTIVSSIVFYRGFEASPVDIVTCVFGFLIICSGVALLQNSHSQKQPKNRTSEENPRESLLPYDSEKYLTSDEEEINHVGTSSNRHSVISWESANIDYRNKESGHHNRSGSYADAISLNTIDIPKNSGKKGERMCVYIES
jgi:hypothetical protein